MLISLIKFFGLFVCFVISFSTINFEFKTEEQFSYKKWSMYALAIQLYDVTFGQFEHDFYCFDWYSWIWLVVFIKLQKSDKNQVATYTERPDKKNLHSMHTDYSEKLHFEPAFTSFSSALTCFEALFDVRHWNIANLQLQSQHWI